MRIVYYLPTCNKLLFEFQFCVELGNFISDRQTQTLTESVYMPPPFKISGSAPVEVQILYLNLA